MIPPAPSPQKLVISDAPPLADITPVPLIAFDLAVIAPPEPPLP